MPLIGLLSDSLFSYTTSICCRFSMISSSCSSSPLFSSSVVSLLSSSQQSLQHYNPEIPFPLHLYSTVCCLLMAKKGSEENFQKCSLLRSKHTTTKNCSIAFLRRHFQPHCNPLVRLSPAWRVSFVSMLPVGP